MTTGHLLPETPLASLDDYRALGGGDGLRRALERDPTWTIDTIRESRLRGRGGAGFPTGIKWAGIAGAPDDQQRFFVCNAAEGEPGTFKDRALMRANPYQLLEGMAIGAHAVGAEHAYIGIKESYLPEIARLESAAGEMAAAGLLGEIPISIATGPDDYLLGEEKALLEAIEGRDPLPRLLPPYLFGLHTDAPLGVGSGSTGPGGMANPTVVNNVETLANVPHILSRGADWFRSIGTEDTPGTMVFTICGDVARETVAELPMGTPLAVLVHGIGEGPVEGRGVRAVIPGASNGPIADAHLDVPMDFGSMDAIGSGLGSGGMIVVDDQTCLVHAVMTLTRFLAIESCGQCPPCKMGTGVLAGTLESLGEASSSAEDDLDELVGWLQRVTDANRCGLGAGAQALVGGLLRTFPEELARYAAGGCGDERRLPLQKLTDHLPDEGRFVRDEDYFDRHRARPR